MVKRVADEIGNYQISTNFNDNAMQRYLEIDKPNIHRKQ